MRYVNSSILIALFSVALGGCQWFSPKKTDNEERVPVAEAADEILYQDDIKRLFGNSASPEDSTTIVDKYVNNWVRKQLLIKKAQEEVDFNEAEIERKVLDYRYALMVHEFEKLKVAEKLDKEISAEEIKTYYEEKRDNFLLRQNIVKCIFAKIPDDAPDISSFSRNLQRYPANDQLEEIKSYCFQFADKYSVEDSTWINFDDIIQNSHLASIPNKVQFLKNNKYMESPDNGFVYFLKILDFKISEDISPLSFIEAEIENIIINKRKVEIKKELEEQIFNEAKSKNEFKIFKK